MNVDNTTPSAPPGAVALVGAGPGNPGLLTLRAAECLGRADLILYDRLVPDCLLEFAPEAAELVCVDELAGCHPDRAASLHRRMIDAARLAGSWSGSRAAIRSSSAAAARRPKRWPRPAWTSRSCRA